jgi:hypothetical protein
MRNKMLKATYGSDKTPLLIGNLKIPCYVLENEMAVLSLRGIQEAIGFKKKSSGDKLTKIIQDKNIVPFIKEELLENLANPIKFKRVTIYELGQDYFSSESSFANFS